MMQRLAVNVGLVLVALVLTWSISLQSGRIVANNGIGYDGVGYAGMVIHRFEDGGPNQRLRPLVLALNQVAYDLLFHDPRNRDRRLQEQELIRAFAAMNFVWAGLLAFALCLILDHYGTSPVHKLIFIANIFATVAVVKMFMYYPVLVDLGAYFWMSLALYAVLRGGRPLILVTTMLAVLSRELALIIPLTGIHRDIRRGAAPWKTVLTYVPSIALFLFLRRWVLSTGQRQNLVLTFNDAITNLAYLVSPAFILYFTYFVLTVFGGLSVLIICRALRRGPQLEGETEWLTYAAVVIACTGAASMDLWRYLAYLLPLAAVLYARGVARDDWRIVLPWTAAITLITQQPWTMLNDDSYFTEFFPLYVVIMRFPDPPLLSFWAIWGIRFLIVAAMTVAVWRIYRLPDAQRSIGPSRSPASTDIAAGVATHVE